MSFNPYLHRRIVVRILRPGILILLALCFLAHWGSALSAGPFSRSVDLLAPPAATPDLVAVAAQPLTLQDHCSAPWLAPEPLPALPPVHVVGGTLLNPDFSQRPISKAHTTPILPRPPPFSLFS